ncbi:hypothetical protein BCV69DRAFT_111695 [Microstroma glucosiphilum]|uniref:Conserved oligomeric Golgi complex subunit 8 n=1 Tax=Pseudomicrostroma glucosiphilum TaxID=1684307 RepID=A0A316UJ15_9BASI|nr:hypothetical protein BCV69DRAFT_111695 [Pseudomicrostroma glucosiphilum]PWN23195.1 hypothetical protein BCV69DRAFT_111695 [Pseudomicrostroma glucosiphilum]
MSTSSPERRLSSLAPNGTSPVRHRRGAASLALAVSNHGGSLPSLLGEMAKQGANQDENLLQLAQNLGNPSSSVSAYLASLTTQPLASLQSQPELLASSSVKLQDQLAALCTRQVGPLVQVHEATRSLPSSLDQQRIILASLAQKSLPRLAEAATSFATRADDTLVARDRAHRLLEAHTSLLSDLLDLPNLIRTCARGGHFAETLQLGLHIARLAQPTSELGGGPALRAIREEAWNALRDFRDSLLEGLKTRSLTIASASRTIAAIRKLRELDHVPEPTIGALALGLSEEELSLSLLRSRASVLREILSAPFAHQQKLRPSQHVAAAHLEGYVSAWRQGIDETCAIVSGVFQDGNASQGNMMASFIQIHITVLQNELAEGVGKLTAPLVSLDPTSSRLPSIPSAAATAAAAEAVASDIQALHTQLAFTAQTLAKWGADIAPLVSGSDRAYSLERSAMQVLSVPLARSRATMQRRMPSNPLTLPSSWLVSQSRAAELISHQNRQPDPRDVGALASFPPLAFLLNDILIGLNATRLFAPLSQREHALSLLDQAFADVTARMASYASNLPEQASSSSLSNLPYTSLPDLEIAGSANGTDVPDVASSVHRRTQAERLLAAIAIDHLANVLIPYARQSLWTEVFGATDPLPPRSPRSDDATEWSKATKAAWRADEKSRLLEIQQLQRDRQAAEAEKSRKAEQERLRVEEETAQRQKDAQRKAEEERAKREKEAEEVRVREEEERVRAEEARLSREREERRIREEEEKKAREEEERRVQEEAEKRLREAEEKRIREAEGKKKAQEEGRRAQEEAQKLQEAEERKQREMERDRLAAEEEATIKREAEGLALRKAAEEKAQQERDIKTQEKEATAPSIDKEGAAKEVAVAQQDETHSISTETPIASGTQTPVSEAGSLVVSAAPPARKLTLAEKLKAKAEARQRQAAASVAAQSGSAPPTPTPVGDNEVSTDSASAMVLNGVSEKTAALDGKARISASEVPSATTASQVVEAAEQRASNEAQNDAIGSKDDKNGAEDEGVDDGQEEEKDDEGKDDEAGHDGDVIEGGGQSTSAKKRKKKKKKSAKG